MYSPHAISISSPWPKPNPKQKKSWLHPMLCMKGSWVTWEQMAHRAAYDASATSEGRQYGPHEIIESSKNTKEEMRI